jgi:hypothetical protein
MDHNCINQRMQTSGRLYVWDFERRNKQLNVRVNGQLTFNTSVHIVEAALAGLALPPARRGIFTPSSGRQADAGTGRLVPPVRWILFVLPQPTATLSGVFACFNALREGV